MSQFIIDDSNFQTHMNPWDKRCGCFPRKVAYGASEFAPKASIKTIPMEEWPDRIADMKRTKSSAKDILLASPIGVLDQGQVGYCHAFSAVAGLMLQREIAGQPYVELSASSVGAPITGYQNQGAVITDDLKQIIEVGVASTAYVPMLTTRREDFKPGWEQEAESYQATQYMELAPRNFQEQVSMLLTRMPVCVGLNYWGHAVLDVEAVDLYPQLAATNANRYGIDFLNSWTREWGDHGFGIRNQSKAPADQAYVLVEIKYHDPAARPLNSLSV